MKVTQVYDIVNTATKAVLGDTAVVNEDLSNIVDIGRSVLGADDKEQIFNGALWDKFYMVVFGGDREISEKFEHLYRSAPEYGALLQKISSKDIPEAEVDETWTARGGDSIDQDIVYDDNITSKVWSWKSNFMIPRTVFDRQLKGAFNGRDEMVGFLNWMELRVRQSMTVKVNILGRMCVNNMIGHVVHTANANRFVNVLTLYNAVYTTAPETAATCLYNPDFIRFFMRSFPFSYISCFYIRHGHSPSVTDIYKEVCGTACFLQVIQCGVHVHHGHHDGTHDNAHDEGQHHDDEGFHGSHDLLGGHLHLFLIVLGQLGEHLLQIAGLLADVDHVVNHGRKQAAALNGNREGVTHGHIVLGVQQGLPEMDIAHGAGHDVDGLDHGDAGA
jgi:hypothetical protein